MKPDETKAAAEHPLDCRVRHGTPRVEALIEQVMADYPGITAHAQARYYEEVHQHLAPLARELERENARMREALMWIAAQRTGGMIQRKATEALHEMVPNA